MIVKESIGNRDLLKYEKTAFLCSRKVPASIVTQETADKRNELMAQLADEIFVAYAQPGGIVERLVMKCLKKGNKVITFNVPENCTLIKAGVEII